VLERLKTGNAELPTLWDSYVEHDLPFTFTLYAMRRGIRVDTGVLEEIKRDLARQMRQAEHVFRLYAPSVSVERKRGGMSVLQEIAPDKLNLRSPSQLAALFYDALHLEGARQGARSTDIENLHKWADDGNVLAECLTLYRGAEKISGTFIGSAGGKGLLSHVQQCSDQGGDYSVIVTDFSQVGAVSGRISSRKPNIQAIPARKDKDPQRMRRSFIARNGYKLIVADYSMIELRMMAHFSGDERMSAAMRDGLDLHSLTAKNIFGLKTKLEHVKDKYPDERNKGKTINFSLNYGMRAPLLAKRLGVTKEEAQRYIDGYFETYPGVKAWMDATVTECSKKGYVRTLLGRRRRLPALQLMQTEDNFGLMKHAENQAVNSPIQGSVADMVKVAMNNIVSDLWLKEHETHLLLQVHDELVLEAPWVYADQACDRVKTLMETAMELDVPVVVDAHVGDNWEMAKH
jgi:DNA polymerase-1